MRPSDLQLLFATRILRIFAYGFVSVTLALYLHALGFGERTVGFLFSLALLGDIVISLWITTSADRVGRRRMLVLGAGLIVLAGGVLSSTGSLALIAVAAFIGVVSPNGSEIGPFISIEQSALAQIVGDTRRTRVFAWYNLAGSFAAALGALAGGALVQGLLRAGYGGAGVLPRGALPLRRDRRRARRCSSRGSPPRWSRRREPSPTTAGSRFGLHRSGRTVFKLSGLFALDAFGGGFVIQGLLAYWFHLRFAVEPAALGGIFFGANLLAGVSALLADRIAARIGLIRTMVFTHIPSNLLLMLVPLMPNLSTAVGLLLVRSSISQMDVPTRQSYTMAVVDPRRAFRGLRRDHDRPLRRRADFADAQRRAAGGACADERAVLFCRRPEDRLRPAPLPRLQEPAAPRGDGALKRSVASPLQRLVPGNFSQDWGIIERHGT